MLLRQMLYRCEIKFLPIIASCWLRLQSVPNYEELIRMLCDRMLDKKTLQIYVNTPENEAQVNGIRLLISKGGSVETETFEAVTGPFRVAGLDRILREKMWQAPASETEKLWYRGIIFRENRFVDGELKECYILPDDLMKNLSALVLPGHDWKFEIPAPSITVRPAIPSETKKTAAPDKKLPEVFCLAAALKRDSRPLSIPGLEITPQYQSFLEMLLKAGGLFKDNQEADPEKIRLFMIHNRIAAQIQLTEIWRHCSEYCELSETDELSVIYSPVFDNKSPRESIIQMLTPLEPDTWWSINGLINAVKSKYPTFLRSYFSEERWRINDRDGNDLNGISSWYQLEGAYLRFLLLGPLYWLGITTIAYADSDEKEASAFRISREGMFLLQESERKTISDEILEKPNLEQDTPGISIDGAVSCSNKVPRYFRYMAARYCDIDSFKKSGDTVFRVTPSSLADAERNELKRSGFLSLLRRFSKNTIPPSLERLLSAGENADLPATIYKATILTVSNPEVFSKLLDTSRLEKWILQQINPTSLIIDPRGIEDIRRFLMENEIFVDIQK